MFKHLLPIILLLQICYSSSYAQFETFEPNCKKYLTSEFVSDGQDYFASLKPDQIIEFKTTFFGNNTYRLIACSSVTEGNLKFSIFDTDKNLLFTNENYDFTPYWNFNFTSTVTCIIQVEMKSNKFRSGYVMLLIAYKQ